jgi:hypothetical protein
LFWGCSGEKADSEETEETPLVAPEGLIPIQSYTINAEDCTGEGVDSLDGLGHEFIFFIAGTIFGQDYVSGYSCADETGCAEMQEAIDNQQGFLIGLTYTFTETDDAGNLSGFSQSTGWSSAEGICEAPERSLITLTYASDGTIVIEEEIAIGDDYPEDADGFCNTDDAADACEGKPCAQKEVLVLAP